MKQNGDDDMIDTDTMSIHESRTQALTFTESSFLTDVLDGTGWREVYHADTDVTVDGTTHRVMKAVYEHPEIGVKATVTPNAPFTSKVPTRHTATFIDPLQSLDELKAFDRPHRDLQFELLPRIPTPPGENPFAGTVLADECTTEFAGEFDAEYPRQCFYESSASLDIAYTAAKEYDWSEFPEQVVSRLDTVGEVNVEYAVDNWVYARELATVRKEYPEVVPEVIEADLRVITVNGEKQASFDFVGTTGDYVREYDSYVNESNIDLNSFADGTVLATATLSFSDSDPTPTPYNPFPIGMYTVFEITDISFTEAGEALQPQTRAERLLQRFQ